MLVVESEKGNIKKKTAQKECCELIMRLWAEREHLPFNARPLGHLDDVLRALLAMRSDLAEHPAMFNRYAEEIKSPWLTFAKDSYAIEKHMTSLAFLTGVLEAGFDQERKWVDEHSKQLSDQEREMIEGLDRWLGRRLLWESQSDQQSVGELQPKERTEIILKELEAVVSKQSKALESLKKQLETEQNSTT